MEPKRKAVTKDPIRKTEINQPIQKTPVKENEYRNFYWIKCWDVKKLFRKRRYYYTVMHSNGNKLGTSQGIDTRSARDEVVKGMMEKGVHMVQWVDKDGKEITRDFKVG